MTLHMQEVHRAVQNAHRMHPNLISAELAAGARELAELSGAIHGDAPGYSPDCNRSNFKRLDTVSNDTFHRSTVGRLRLSQNPSGKCHDVEIVELGGKTCHCGVRDDSHCDEQLRSANDKTAHSDQHPHG